VRPGAFAAQPLRVIAGGDQQHRGGIRADAVQGQQARRAGGDQRADQLIEPVQLGVQEPVAADWLAQRDPAAFQGGGPGGQDLIQLAEPGSGQAGPLRPSPQSSPGRARFPARPGYSRWPGCR